MIGTCTKKNGRHSITVGHLWLRWVEHSWLIMGGAFMTYGWGVYGLDGWSIHGLMGGATSFHHPDYVHHGLTAYTKDVFSKLSKARMKVWGIKQGT